ncbi:MULTISPECIES: hypothetical protein [Bacillaceae]|uniref:Lipoprotein n=1 Tax=Bacillus infantis TaxID=324767 RepID=A0A5D4SQI9_9BACI|nr:MULTISPECIES: hypothetical protein [Bacillus]MCP1158719.1 hypothetical protein [Bacillus infantis]MDW2877699.1 hypothetical protein [Bacillus infantis]TYS65031.1 hypothetical protein FZD47_06685 [Bacillus infantis]
MKKNILILLLLMLAAILAGCSAEEVLSVGKPFHEAGVEGVRFHTEVDDSAQIQQLRSLLDDLTVKNSIGEPGRTADTAFVLKRPKQGVAEKFAYLWYTEDGTAVLKEGERFYLADKEQAGKLKKLLDQQ